MRSASRNCSTETVSDARSAFDPKIRAASPTSVCEEGQGYIGNSEGHSEKNGKDAMMMIYDDDIDIDFLDQGALRGN